MQFKLPILVWRLDLEAAVTVCPKVIGRSLLRVVRIQNPTVLIQLQHVREDSVNLLNRAGLTPIQGKVVHAFERVLRPARHEISERPQRSAE